MINPVLVPYKAAHLMSFEDRDKWTVNSWQIALGRETGPAFTGMVDDQIIGCAGVMLPWPGMGIAWVTVSPVAVLYHGYWMTRSCRRVLNDVVRAFNLHRLEAVALADSDTNQRWLELLGFVREDGRATAYLPDKRDVIRYERITPCTS